MGNFLMKKHRNRGFFCIQEIKPVCFIREIFMGLLFNLVRQKNRRRLALSGFLVIKCIF